MKIMFIILQLIISENFSLVDLLNYKKFTNMELITKTQRQFTVDGLKFVLNDLTNDSNQNIPNLLNEYSPII